MMFQGGQLEKILNTPLEVSRGGRSRVQHPGALASAHRQVLG